MGITIDKINKLKDYGLHLIPIEKKRPKSKRIGTNGSTDYSWKFSDIDHTEFLKWSDAELLKWDLGLNHEASRTLAVDFDSDEAVKFQHLLPTTFTVSSVYDGAPQVRQKIYKLADDVKEEHTSYPKNPKSEDGTVIEELTHTQSWIDGGNRFISNDITPKTLNIEEYESVRATIRKVYALSMFTRLYPKKDSSRDEFRLTLAGVLNSETKWDMKEKKEFVKELCKASGDNAVGKALEKLQRVEKNIKKGDKKVWSTNHMAELLGRPGKEGGLDFIDVIRDPSFLLPDQETDIPKTKPQGLTTLTLNQFVERNYPPIEYYMYPIISNECLGMIFALPGKGKTLFALELAWRCSQGLDFMDWKFNHMIKKPPPVLYVEGEMSATQIQDRINNMIDRDRGIKDFDMGNFHIAVLKEQPNENYQKLQTHEGRLNVQMKADEITKKTGRKPIIFLDNIRFLMGNFNEKEGQDWIDVVLWLATLRAKGYSTYVLHHAVNTGEKASGSGYQESNLDVSIKLSQPDENSSTEHNPDHFTQIQFEFKKMRENVIGHMTPFIMVVDRDKGIWSKFPVLNKNERKVKSMLDDGKTAKDIINPKKDGMSKANVHKIIKKLKGENNGVDKKAIDGKTKEVC